MVTMKANYCEKKVKVRNFLNCWGMPPSKPVGKSRCFKKFNRPVYILSPLPASHATLDERLTTCFIAVSEVERGKKLSGM